LLFKVPKYFIFFDPTFNFAKAKRLSQQNLAKAKTVSQQSENLKVTKIVESGKTGKTVKPIKVAKPRKTVK